MKFSYLFVLTSFLLYTPLAWSQCAAGVDTGGGQCTPPDAQGMPGYQQAPRPRAVWADRWGAIATDTETGDAGTIEGQEGKATAEKKALAQCGSTGASHCQIRLTFRNQCAAAALGDGAVGFAGSPTEDDAKKRAVIECGNEASCKIVYSACSYAERAE
jgi:Domain of unknown function (DUF4189)